MDFSSLLQPILQNQVVTGLSFTAILGAAAYQLRSIPRLIRSGMLRFFSVELTIMSTDATFDWINRWLAQQPYAKKTKMMMLNSHTSENSDSPNVGVVNLVNKENAPTWDLSPGPGLHVFWWRGRPIFLDRRFLSKENDKPGKPVEILHFRTVGRSQKIIRKLIEEVHNLSIASDLVSIRMWNDYYWNPVRGKSQRALDTIILKPGQTERLLDDLHWFIDARHWYRERGIPYRRGYLLSGKSGTGKTSIVLSIAGFLNRPICVLNLGSIDNDDALFMAFSTAATDAIILIEDIDCAFASHSRETTTERSDNKVSKAGLLNALDGIATPDGRIFIMTTNYPERLDYALIRPGRADVHEVFTYLDQPEQIRMAERFYNEAFNPLPFPVSPALMQAAFMQYPTDPEAARSVLFAVEDHEIATDI